MISIHRERNMHTKMVYLSLGKDIDIDKCVDIYYMANEIILS